MLDFCLLLGRYDGLWSPRAGHDCERATSLSSSGRWGREAECSIAYSETPMDKKVVDGEVAIRTRGARDIDETRQVMVS